MNLKGSRVVVYARYSSDRQSDASIADQVRRCGQFVEGHGGRVEPDLVFADHAVSGACLQRPAFEKLMELVTAKPKRVDFIVTEDVSRLSRDFADAAVLFKQLQFLGIGLLGVADGIDSTARNAKVAFTFKSLMNDMFLDDLRDKTLRGLQGRALKGFSTGGLPYGYRSVATPDGHRIEIDETQAEVVRRVFRAYLGGTSLAGIATILNREGVPSPRAGSKHLARGWVAGTIRAFLHNERYAGVWVFGKTKWVKVPGTNKRRPQAASDEAIRQERPDLRIIGPAVWRAVRERLADVHAKYTRSPRTRRPIAGRASAYPFSGLLFCGVCSAPMIIYGGSAGARYRCGDNLKRGTCANRLSVLERVVRTRILEALHERLGSADGVTHVRRRLVEGMRDLARAVEAELGERRERLARTEARIQALIGMLADDELSRSAYMKKTLLDHEAQARLERETIADLEERTRVPIRLPTVEEVVRRVYDLEKTFDREPTRARESLRQLLRDGRIRLVPQDDGVYVARADILPLAIMLHENAAPGFPGAAPLSSASSGGRI